MADRHHQKKDRADAATVREAQEAPAGEKTPAFDRLGLSQEVLDAVAEMGHVHPTPVQAQAIPLVLAGRDVLAAAQTGTGKTEAFLLPTLSRLGHVGAGEGPLMLVITPTRELAQQIDGVARTICAHTGHRTVTLVGGVAYEPQYQALERGCDVLVATPGRLQDLLDSGHASLDHVGVLVLDEADRMLDMGFLPAVKKIVARTPSERQTLLFSATLDDDAIASTRSLVHDPAHVKIARKGTPAQTIEQFALGVSPEAKHAVLAEVLRREGAERVIVFTRGKHRADAICRKLRKAGFSCAPIHGNRTQRQRENALRSFREGAVDVLVATDVLARGIDIPDVRYVVNFDMPGDAEDYIHRIGRTGRAGESGWALTFVTEDDYLELRDAEALMGKVVPDYPRAGGIDLGAEPLRLDPARDPREKLPGKKARKKMAEELDKELFDIGLGVRDVNIISVSYPPEVQKMAEKVAAQSFITDTGKYVTVAAADGMEKGDSVAGLGAQVAIGAQIAQQLSGQTQTTQAPAAPAADGLEDRFCTKCRKMVRGNFCPYCGTPTV